MVRVGSAIFSKKGKELKTSTKNKRKPQLLCAHVRKERLSTFKMYGLFHYSSHSSFTREFSQLFFVRSFFFHVRVAQGLLGYVCSECSRVFSVQFVCESPSLLLAARVTEWNLVSLGCAVFVLISSFTSLVGCHFSHRYDNNLIIIKY